MVVVILVLNQITAVKDHDMLEIERLLMIKVDPNVKEPDEVSNTRKLKCNITLYLHYGRTALLWACIKGFEDIVQLLIDHQANVNAEDVNQ